MKKITITEEVFIDTMFDALSETLYVDTTDYYNFIGFRDILRNAWSFFGKRKKWKKEKWGIKTGKELKKKSLIELEKEREAGIKLGIQKGTKQERKKYKKIIGSIYFKNNDEDK